MSAVTSASLVREGLRRLALGANAWASAPRKEIHAAGKFSKRCRSATAEGPTSFRDWVSSAYKQAGFNKEASVRYYENTAHLYDKLHTESVWLAPLKVASLAREMTSLSGVPPETSLALDFGAGTGQLGVALGHQGFQHVHAVEPSANMLDVAHKDTYSHAFRDVKDAADDGYDVVVSTGVIGTHVDASGLLSVLSKVNVGGHMIFSCKACSWDKDGFVQVVDGLSASGTWRHGILFGPAPLLVGMPGQNHVIVYLTRMA